MSKQIIITATFIAIILSNLALAAPYPSGSVSLPAWAGGYIPIWTTQQSASPGHWLTGQMLDTFSNHIEIQANTNITVAVMTINQYAILQADVIFGLNKPYNTIAFYNGSRVSFYFNTSEGCSSYMYIIYNNDHRLDAFNITPNITAEYKPAPKLLGICNKSE